VSVDWKFEHLLSSLICKHSEKCIILWKIKFGCFDENLWRIRNSIESNKIRRNTLPWRIFFHSKWYVLEKCPHIISTLYPQNFSAPAQNAFSPCMSLRYTNMLRGNFRTLNASQSFIHSYHTYVCLRRNHFSILLHQGQAPSYIM